MKYAGLILAGGRGQRLGGVDKGLQSWGDTPMIEAVINRLQPQIEPLLISCNRNLERYSQFQLALVTDDLPDFQGPLAGISSALIAHRPETLVVVPCDTPELPKDLVQRLLSELEQGALDLCWSHDGIRDHYLCCAIRGRCLTSLTQYLSSGGRSMRGWIQRLRAGTADFSDQPLAFRNLNTASDFSQP